MFIDASAYQAEAQMVRVAAQAQPSSPDARKIPHKLGACSEVKANSLYPVRAIFDAEHYFLKYKKGPAVIVRKGPMLVVLEKESDVDVAKPPRHGTLKPFLAFPGSTSKTYHYKPNQDYVGMDNFEVDVSLEGKTLRIYYQFKVFAEDEDSNRIGYCNWDDQKYYWKISQLPDFSDSAVLDASVYRRMAVSTSHG